MRFTATEYIDDVLSGRQVACKWVRLACERHQRDLETGHERGLYFDEMAAKTAIAFFSVLCHWKGEWAGRPVMLEPWQQFVTWCLFGWKREDGLRRFRTCYLEVARKNGKTTWAAGLGLYLMVADNEPGAEIYTAATKRDQARISHTDAKEMVRRSPALRRMIRTYKDNLHSEQTGSKFEPLGRDADSVDGLNVHGVIADELHAWPTGELWGVLETATGARRQPLIVATTTAGFNQSSYCMEQRRYVEAILDGIIEDDTYFGIIYTIDDEDMEIDEKMPADEQRWWEDESLWIKSNPNLGISKKAEQMRQKAQRASQIASNWTHFITKELNVWTQSSIKWVNVSHWQACGRRTITEAELYGRRCYAGLDLSSNTDTTALVYLFPPIETDEPWWVIPRFFIPYDNMIERVRRDRVPYDVWVDQGYIIATPGNVVDYGFILKTLEEDGQLFDVAEIAVDRWGATDIQVKLMEFGGDDWLVLFGQGFASMSGPMKKTEQLILGHQLGHNNNPVLTWQAYNLVARTDSSENIKPDKDKSIERIDGMVALIMANGRAMLQGGQQKSVYEERGILTL